MSIEQLLIVDSQSTDIWKGCLRQPEKPTRHPTKTRIKFIERCKVQGLCQSCFDQVAVQQLTMLCLYSCWTALLTVSAHETGRHKVAEGAMSNTEAPHGLPGGRHTLVLQADLGSQQSSQKAIRLVLQHLAICRSQAIHNNHRTCDIDEFRQQRWGDDDLARCKCHSECHLPSGLAELTFTTHLTTHAAVREACICTGLFWPKK